MTLAIGFSCAAGGVIVSDRRVIAGASIVSDAFVKHFVLAEGRYGVAIAGEIGPAQVWMRACSKLGVKKLPNVEAVIAEHCGGDFAFILYDGAAGRMYSGDGCGSLVEHAPNTTYAIGAGADFLLGYLAAVDSEPGSLPIAQAWFEEAIAACAVSNVSVSRECDVLRIERLAETKGAKRVARKPARKPAKRKR